MMGYQKILFVLALAFQSMFAQTNKSYPVVDTGVTEFYNSDAAISAPKKGDDFYAQDAHHKANKPSYTDNKDGTITDNVTGLMWQKEMPSKMGFEDAFAYAKSSRLGGYDDWRMPTIKELYSLILFTGRFRPDSVKPFIDTRYFVQPLGQGAAGERIMDAQTWSATVYTGRTMRGDESIFGVNFIDGRIKGYPKYDPRTGAPHKMYCRLVRGNKEYGKNRFVDNKNKTVSDKATGLMWQKEDSKSGMDWRNALKYCEELSLGGYNDWRLPNAKELQSIVDYKRSPQATGSAAIDPIFSVSRIDDSMGSYPYFWSSTTHLDGPNPYMSAVYIAFGEAKGKMRGALVDAHGAGAQRSDPKNGNKGEYPQYFGPQGDLRSVFNYVRCVRSEEK